MKRSRPRRRSSEEIAQSLLWVIAVHERAGDKSQLSGKPSEVAHHVCTQQALRKRGLGRTLWDTRNGMALTVHEHESHHSRHRPILFSELPYEALAFAGEYGLEDYLRRTYPEEA